MFAEIIASKDFSGQVPVAVTALNVRSKPYERTRMRCVDPDCPLRRSDEKAELLANSSLGPTCEINRDDKDSPSELTTNPIGRVFHLEFCILNKRRIVRVPT